MSTDASAQDVARPARAQRWGRRGQQAEATEQSSSAHCDLEQSWRPSLRLPSHLISVKADLEAKPESKPQAVSGTRRVAMPAPARVECEEGASQVTALPASCDANQSSAPSREKRSSRAHPAQASAAAPCQEKAKESGEPVDTQGKAKSKPKSSVAKPTKLASEEEAVSPQSSQVPQPSASRNRAMSGRGETAEGSSEHDIAVKIKKKDSPQKTPVSKAKPIGQGTSPENPKQRTGRVWAPPSHAVKEATQVADEAAEAAVATGQHAARSQPTKKSTGKAVKPVGEATRQQAAEASASRSKPVKLAKGARTAKAVEGTRTVKAVEEVEGAKTAEAPDVAARQTQEAAMIESPSIAEEAFDEEQQQAALTSASQADEDVVEQTVPSASCCAGPRQAWEDTEKEDASASKHDSLTVTSAAGTDSQSNARDTDVLSEGSSASDAALERPADVLNTPNAAGDAEDEEGDAFLAVCAECGAVHMVPLDMMAMNLDFCCADIGEQCEASSKMDTGRSPALADASEEKAAKAAPLTAEERKLLAKRHESAWQSSKESRKEAAKHIQEVVTSGAMPRMRYLDGRVVSWKGEKQLVTLLHPDAKAAQKQQRAEERGKAQEPVAQ
eukprot:TRINITY_DN25567_c0_g1_i2.p1 TRINITY_DN25567_c0_g1~~TRINITY_DN25567_c0_g1_i2.p1  ORF type:complete len:615 (+),score=167.99 TRINITY_DN25567_c0_g1_i2:32-1876(+)